VRRYELLQNLLPVLEPCLVVCNIGIPSQELKALKDADNHFYMLGSMGLCSSIGLGLALSTEQPVVAIEGDGAVLMNLSTLATIGNRAPDNYVLLVVDNGSYGSTGDQVTYTGEQTSLADMARGAGCRNVVECNGEDAAAAVQAAIDRREPSVIVARVEAGNAEAPVIRLHPIVIRERFKAVVAAGMADK